MSGFTGFTQLLIVWLLAHMYVSQIYLNSQCLLLKITRKGAQALETDVHGVKTRLYSTTI